MSDDERPILDLVGDRVKRGSRDQSISLSSERRPKKGSASIQNQALSAFCFSSQVLRKNSTKFVDLEDKMSPSSAGEPLMPRRGATQR
jgi:hypothetical protein